MADRVVTHHYWCGNCKLEYSILSIIMVFLKDKLNDVIINILKQCFNGYIWDILNLQRLKMNLIVNNSWYSLLMKSEGSSGNNDMGQVSY
jgi:hypothetical protein